MHFKLQRAKANGGTLIFQPSRLIATSTGLAIPKDKTRYGYISEHHSYGQKETLAGEYAEDLAAVVFCSYQTKTIS